jgi:predicted  nucleic acid-binding Zn-ribbon protein
VNMSQDLQEQIVNLKREIETFKNHCTHIEKVVRETRTNRDICRKIIDNLTNDNIALNVNIALLNEEKTNLQHQIKNLTQPSTPAAPIVTTQESNVVKMKPGRKKKIVA